MGGLTERLASIDPPTLLSAPIYPEDFAIAVPALFATAAVKWQRGRQVWRGLVLAGVLMVIGLTLGAMTAGWSVPLPDTAPGQFVEIAADGSVTLTPDNGPGTLAASMVRLAQNAIVYFNLLVLPVLILAEDVRR